MRRFGIILGLLMTLTLTITVDASTDDLAERAPKSKRTARMLSLGSTILPIALGIALTTSESEPMDELGVFLIGGGLIIGPGVGQAYADRPVRFAGGAIVRTLCLGLAGTALVVATLGTDSNERVPALLFFAGVGGYTFSAIYDITTTGSSVDAYNRKHAAPQFSVGHIYYPQENTHGLALTLRF